MVEERQHRLIFDTLLLGAVGALSAQLFTFLLGVSQTVFLGWLAAYHAPGLPVEGGALRQMVGPYGLWLVPVATALGGLMSGVLVYSLAPEAEGHGTDTVVKAFHHSGGFLRPRVAPLKMIASAITIGSGGAAGREGPTALISAGIGSIYADFTGRSEEDRRLLVLVGMAAGLSAIFRSPIGTAIFAIEVLYSGMEFEGAALLYTMLGSVVAYVLNGLFVGWEPLFRVPGIGVPGLEDYAWYGVLGAASGLVATLLPAAFYGLRDLFAALPFRPHFKPALGGLCVGLLALWLPQVLGGGYGWIQEAIDGRLPAGLLLLLLFAKMIAFALTVSSGGSGGVFAPSLFVGAMLGGFLAEFLGQPAVHFVIVGMAAVFGGAARVPVATLLMVTEMTGGYHLLVPAALAVMLSYLLQVILSNPLKYRSLYEAQVPARSDSPAHHVEHLRVALDLLGKGRISNASEIGHVDLITLLNSGVPITLPGQNRIVSGKLRPDSQWVGKALREASLKDMGDDLSAVALLRDGRLSTGADNLLRQGDQLIVIGPDRLMERCAQHLAPVPHESGGT